MTKSRNIHAKRRQWTDEEIRLFKLLYPFTLAQTLAKYFQCSTSQIYSLSEKLKIKKSDWFKAGPLAAKLTNQINPGKEHWFKKGHIPANKGIKGICDPRSIPTQFKPGCKPFNIRPIGFMRIEIGSGYYLIKMHEKSTEKPVNYYALHRIVWERHNGKIPNGYIVTFIDRNQQNWQISNLSLISKYDHIKRQSVHSYGKELAEIAQLKSLITRKIKKIERQQHEQ